MSIKKLDNVKYHIEVSVRIPGKDSPVKKRETFYGSLTKAKEREVELKKWVRENREAEQDKRGSAYRFGDLLDLLLDAFLVHNKESTTPSGVLQKRRDLPHGTSGSSHHRSPSGRRPV